MYEGTVMTSYYRKTKAMSCVRPSEELDNISTGSCHCHHILWCAYTRHCFYIILTCQIKYLAIFSRMKLFNVET